MTPLTLLKVLSKCSCYFIPTQNLLNTIISSSVNCNSNFNITIYTKSETYHPCISLLILTSFLFLFYSDKASTTEGTENLRGRYQTQPVPCPLVFLFMPQICLSTVCMTTCRPADSAMSKTYCSLIGQSLQSSGRDKYTKNYYRRKKYSNCYQREREGRRERRGIGQERERNGEGRNGQLGGLEKTS